MSSTHVQLWLIALAIVVYATFALGLRWQSRSSSSRRIIGAIAAATCVAAPTAVAILSASGDRGALVPSLQFAAAGSVVMALYALLGAPRKSLSDPIESAACASVVARRAPQSSAAVTDVDSTGSGRLDLDETERLFRSLQRKADPIDLPDRHAWAGAPIDATEHGELLPGGHRSAGFRSASGEIVEAELLPESDRSTLVLDAERIGGSPAEAESTRRVQRAERLVAAERKARIAAEALITNQRSLIEGLQQDVKRHRQRCRTLKSQLEQHERMLAKANDTARVAARIARDAATARVESERLLTLERAARERQQQATDRAVSIARNAIAALPTRDANPDDRDVDMVAASDVDANMNGSHTEPLDR